MGNTRRKSASNNRKRSSGSGKIGLAAAASWPVFESLVADGWLDTTDLTEILIAKEPPFGGVVTCMFLVDLKCLGLKQGFVSQFKTKSEYERGFRAIWLSRRPLIRSTLPLATKLIRESIRYAKGLGFTPPIAAQGALLALGPLAPADECPEEIPLGGKDGKPLYIAGPDDDIDHILSTLTRRCGQGNFHFMVPGRLM